LRANSPTLLTALTGPRTAGLAIVASVLIPLAHLVESGHVSTWGVIAAAVAIMGSLAKSALSLPVPVTST
jgi:hypothetical protein